jgi:hypothetical protein
MGDMTRRARSWGGVGCREVFSLACGRALSSTTLGAATSLRLRASGNLAGKARVRNLDFAGIESLDEPSVLHRLMKNARRTALLWF